MSHLSFTSRTELEWLGKKKFTPTPETSQAITALEEAELLGLPLNEQMDSVLPQAVWNFCSLEVTNSCHFITIRNTVF